MKPTFKDFAKVLGELVAANDELANAPLDEATTAAYVIFKGLLAVAQESK